MSKNKFTFKYFSPSLDKEYPFLYGEKRRLNHWFKYYLFPKYGRYLFLYDSRDNVYIEKLVFLSKEKKTVKLFDDIQLQREHMDIMINDNLTKMLEQNSRNIHSEQQSYLNRVKDKRSATSEFSRLKRFNTKKGSISNSERAFIGGIRMSEVAEKLDSKLESLPRHVDLYTEYLLKNNIRDGVFLKENWELNTGKNREIVDFSDFIIQTSIEETFSDIVSNYEDLHDTKKELYDSRLLNKKMESLEKEIKEDIKGYYNNYALVKTMHDLIVSSSENIINKKEKNLNTERKNQELKKLTHVLDYTDTSLVDLKNGEKDISLDDSLVYSKSCHRKMEQNKSPIFNSIDNRSIIEESYTNNLEKYMSKTVSDLFGATHLKEVVSATETSDLDITDNNMVAEKIAGSTLDKIKGYYMGERVSSKEYNGGMEEPISTRRFNNSPIFSQSHERFAERSSANKDTGANKEEDYSISRMGGDNLFSNDHIGDLEKTQEKESYFNLKNIPIVKSVKSKQVDVEVDEQLKSTEKTILQEELETRLDITKRLWFVSQYDNKVDYKILPNENHDYSDISILMKDDSILKEYKFNHFLDMEEFEENGVYSVVVYDNNYNRLGSHAFVLDEYENIENNISITSHSASDNEYMITIKFPTDQFPDAEYIIIRHPRNKKGYQIQYAVTEKMLEEQHPIPFGEDLGLKEIPIPINIMFDFINMLLLMWSKFHFAFTGYTGGKAIYGLLNVVYDWLVLESSSEHESIDYYLRCFRWLRWEAEKTYNKAKSDPELTGNFWIENLIEELIDYMIAHHVDEMIEFEPVWKMDEYRNSFDDPTFDLDIVLNKFKGVRKRVIETKKDVLQ